MNHHLICLFDLIFYLASLNTSSFSRVPPFQTDSTPLTISSCSFILLSYKSLDLLEFFYRGFLLTFPLYLFLSISISFNANRHYLMRKPSLSHVIHSTPASLYQIPCSYFSIRSCSFLTASFLSTHWLSVNSLTVDCDLDYPKMFVLCEGLQA
jgi:hypothetical protein